MELYLMKKSETVEKEELTTEEFVYDCHAFFQILVREMNK